MAMETLTASQDIFSLQTLINAAFAVRYELTFGAVLLVLWCMGQLAGLNQKPRGKAKPTSCSPMHFKKPPSPRSGAKPQTRRESNVSNLASPPTPIAQLGPIDQIDKAQLCDPSWVVPQVICMCRSQVQQSLVLYRAALRAGLKLGNLSENEHQELFVAMVTSAIRAGHMDDAMQVLRDMRQLGRGVNTSLFCSVAKLCTSKHLFAECLAFYNFMAEESGFALTDKTVWSCLLFSAIENHTFDRCNFFFEQLKACGTPSQKDFGNMVRLAALQGDWKLSLKLIDDVQEENIPIDSIMYNTVLGTCVTSNQIDKGRELLEKMACTEGLADVITYNTLMKGYSKAGCMQQCSEVFQLLKTRGIAPSQVTYGIVLDGYINDNQLERAAEVFSDMNKEGYVMNTVLFTTLIKGFARAGEVDQAMKVYEQMKSGRNVTPDLITFSILIKCNCDADRLEVAFELLEAMVKLNLHPDEVVFNSLLAGCARVSNAKLGKVLYAEMVSSGIRPSNATFSILIRLFLQCKILEEAVEMLRTEPAKHNVDLEPRIFVQLMQSCIRERQGRRAVEVYEMLAERSLPSASVHKSVLSTCAKLNMFDTAAEILGIVASKGGKVDKEDAQSLLDSSLRKRKSQVAQDIVTSMQKLGMSVDPSVLKG